MLKFILKDRYKPTIRYGMNSDLLVSYDCESYEPDDIKNIQVEFTLDDITKIKYGREFRFDKYIDIVAIDIEDEPKFQTGDVFFVELDEYLGNGEWSIKNSDTLYVNESQINGLSKNSVNKLLYSSDLDGKQISSYVRE